MIYNFKLLLVFWWLLAISTVMANERKNNLQKLYINSDNLVIDQGKMQAQFTGEVILWFDDLMVKTTDLEIFYKIIGNKKTIYRIIMPSKLTAKKNDTKELLMANSAEYFVKKKELILVGDVVIQKDEHIIKTDKLVYYTQQLNNIDF
jgi:lipopolysaccharide export system protein LptA